MLMRFQAAVFAIAALFALSPVIAADKGKHGGHVVESSGHHLLEIVADGNSLTVYVFHDDGEVEDASGAKATASVLSGGNKEDIVLSPAGENVLKGAGSTEIGMGAIIVVTLTMPNHGPEQARVKLE